MGKQYRAEHNLFRKLFRFGLDHHNRIARGRNHQIQFAGGNFCQ